MNRIPFKIKALTVQDAYFSFFSDRNDRASLIKLAVIRTIMAPIGNAAIILTDCRLLIELSENTSAIGSRISSIHHISWIRI